MRRVRRIARDRRGVAGFQETLVSALVITIATMILLVGLARAIGTDSMLRIEAGRASEADRFLASVESSLAFDDGVLDLSRSGAIANLTERASGTFGGARVTVDLVLDDGPEIELGRLGTVPEGVREVESRLLPVSVRTSSSEVTAGVLVVSLWWD